MRALLDIADLPTANLDLIDAAFVHESAAKEHRLRSNERLEFLGDSVLGCIVATWLYARFADDKEGVLARRKAAIVNDHALAQSARRLGFSDLVVLGAGMRNSGGSDNTSILADAFEAFVAVVFLHYGFEKARAFVEHEHIPQTDHTDAAIVDAKSMLQEFAQEHLAFTPVYHEDVDGTPQARRFTSHVTIKGETLGTGTGASKNAAQQSAAAIALATLQARIT
ncbi:MAG: ribonuclease III [Candidatus Baltobacteraceae bacterium]